MSMRNIYGKIAKEYGVSVSEVKRKMQSAIDHAYSSTNTSRITETKKTPIHSHTRRICAAHSARI